MTDPSALLLFHPDAFGSADGRIMGRNAAGSGFLRAFVETRRGPVAAMGIDTAAEAGFRALVRSIDPDAGTEWLASSDWAGAARFDVVHVPGPGLGDVAAKRRRLGDAAFSLVGITHTLASDRALRAIAETASAAVMPWDALICTSRVAREVVETVLAAEEERLATRLGATRFVRPMLPVVPLGVHAADFAFDAQRRTEARARLGLAPDEVAAIFTGRLSFHAKAHPLPMYVALEEAQRRSGRRLVLVQSSWFANGFIEEAFKDGATRFCPSVRCLWRDGSDPQARADVWAGGDIFVSLADNVQETFGLTPVEAMAAGLPAVVSDWNGYRDTIRDGLDGFLIPTSMPAAPFGAAIASAYERGVLNYDQYCGAVALPTGVDLATLVDRLTALVSDPALRRRLGDQGRQRAWSTFDWRVVMGQYRELWAACAERRRAEAPASAPPRAMPAAMDPFALFACYPTEAITGASRALPGPLAGRASEVVGHGLFGHAPAILPRFAEAIAALAQALASSGPVPLRVVAQRSGLDVSILVLAAGTLAKMGVIVLDNPRPAHRHVS